MAEKIRITGPTLKLLKCFLENPQEQRSGASISKATGIGSGTMYPLLQKLEMANWIKGEWENVEPSEVGRPRRRFYKLTPTGQTEARKVLAEFQISTGGSLAWT